MAFTCDTDTRAELNGAPTKKQWAIVLNSALGNTRRIRCKRDANPLAADAWLTGIEFRNVGSTGAFVTRGGKIIKLGKINNITVSQAADMSTGASVLRIEGNNRWIQGTLGLSRVAQMAAGIPEGSVVDYDFTVGSNFTANNGFAVTLNFTLSAFRLLPSGVGTPAPALDANSPASVEVWNWQDPGNPVLVGAIPFNNRQEDFCYEDVEMAEENGDIAVYQSHQSVMYGEHEFGATMFVSDKHNTEVGNIHQHQILISMATRGTWTTYPEETAWDKSIQTTFPKPFKILVKNAGGTTIGTIQQQDGLPVNSPSMSQFRSDTVALRPHTETGMMLPWWNTPPKTHSKMNKYYTGMTPEGARPSQARGHYTFLASPPLVTGGYQRNSQNGLFDFNATPKWPQPRAGYPNTTDNYFPGEFNQNGGSAYAAPWACGWGYEPGSYSQHDWFTGPGGPRGDRCVIPSVLAHFATNPTGNRPFENTPWKEMAHAWILAYFNHSNHWVKDVKAMHLTSTKEIYSGVWSTRANYYGDAPKQLYGIHLNAVANAASRGPQHDDYTGRMIWQGWARDTLHSYTNAGWGAVLFNSPMHAIGCKFDFFTQAIMQGPPGGSLLGSYMVRDQAWDWMHHVLMWKLASSHPLGVTRNDVELRVIKMLEAIYDQLYYPTMVELNDHPRYVQLRKMGTYSIDGGGAMGGGLGLYMSLVFVMMKQFGMWSALKKRVGEKSKAWTAMMFHMRNFDEWVFGYLAKTRAAYGHYVFWGSNEADIPNSWEDYEARMLAKWGPDGDWNKLGAMDDRPWDGYVAPRGALVSERDVADHALAMYPRIRRDFFPEIPHPLLQAANDKLDMYYKRVTDRVNAAIAADPTNYGSHRAGDHIYRYPGLAPIKAPTELGPE